MEVYLLHNRSENNAIGKQYTSIARVSALIKGEISVENPTLILDYTEDSTGINYMYIGEYDRYYFINEIRHITGSRYEIKATVDVLESFKTDIKALSCIIDKQQSPTLSNKYINDGDWIATQREFTRIHEFPNGFNETGQYILICAGG